jgi:hypothetical protein
VGEVSRTGRAPGGFARSLLTAIVALASAGCAPAEIDFAPLDAAADATASDEAGGHPGATSDAVAADAPDSGPPCSPDDPNCHPCQDDGDCFGQCSPLLRYCVECVDHCPYGKICVANQCVRPCSPQNPCPRSGTQSCDPSGFCRDCENDRMCDASHVCRRTSGTCVECLTSLDCSNGNPCSVDFTCYFLPPIDDGGLSGSHDH